MVIPQTQIPLVAQPKTLKIVLFLWYFKYSVKKTNNFRNINCSVKYTYEHINLLNLGMAFDTLTQSFSLCLITQSIIASGDIVGSTRVADGEMLF